MRSAMARWMRRRLTLDLVLRYLRIRMLSTVRLATEDTRKSAEYGEIEITWAELNRMSLGSSAK